MLRAELKNAYPFESFGFCSFVCSASMAIPKSQMLTTGITRLRNITLYTSS